MNVSLKKKSMKGEIIEHYGLISQENNVHEKTLRLLKKDLERTVGLGNDATTNSLNDAEKNKDLQISARTFGVR